MHETVSSLRNRFLSVIGSRTLSFGRKRYGRLFLRISDHLSDIIPFLTETAACIQHLPIAGLRYDMRDSGTI